MRHLQVIEDLISFNNSISDINDFPIVTYTECEDIVRYHKLNAITVTYNVTSIGENTILENTINGNKFDLSLLLGMVVDKERLIPASLTYNFETTGIHTVSFLFLPVFESISRMFNSYDSPLALPDKLEVDFTKFRPRYLKNIRTLFQNCTALTNVGDLSLWNGLSFNNIAYLFNNCNSLTTVGDISRWNTSNCSSTVALFSSCKELNSIGDLNKWDMSNITDMRYMFYNCYKLTSVGDLSNWNLSNVRQIYQSFLNCSSLESIGKVDNWGLNNISDMTYTFYGCSNLKSIGDIGKWDMSNTTNVYGMFYGCKNLTSVGDISSWDLSKMNVLDYLFYNCHNLTSVGDLSNWDVSNIAYFQDTFGSCFNITSIGDTSSWHAPKCVSIHGLFGKLERNSTFELQNPYPKIRALDLSNLLKGPNVLRNAYGTFVDCGDLTTIGDLSEWNTSALTNLGNTFFNCKKLSYIGDLKNWDVSNLTSALQTFCRCESLTNIGDISSWDTHNLKTADSMFRECFKLPPETVKMTENWDMSNCTSIRDIFNNVSRDYPMVNDVFKPHWGKNKFTNLDRIWHYGPPFIEVDLSEIDFANIGSMTEGFWMTRTRIIHFGKNLRENIGLANCFNGSKDIIYFDFLTSTAAWQRVAEAANTKIAYVGEVPYKRIDGVWTEISLDEAKTVQLTLD